MGAVSRWKHMLQPCACLGIHSLGNLRTLLTSHAAFHNSGLNTRVHRRNWTRLKRKGHGGPRGVWRHSGAAWPAHRLRPTLGVSAWERDRERGVSVSSDSTRRRPTRKRKPASTVELIPMFVGCGQVGCSGHTYCVYDLHSGFLISAATVVTYCSLAVSPFAASDQK